MQLYAKLVYCYGTSQLQVIVSDRDHDSRLIPVHPATVDVLRKLIRAGGRGIESSKLSPDERCALNHDIKFKLGVPLRGVAFPHRLRLADNVTIVDQRTFAVVAA